MNRFYRFLATLLVLTSAFWATGCGGGTSTPPPPPPPPQPTVTITAPANNATVSGMVPVVAQVTNPPAGAQIQFRDGAGNLGQPIAVVNGQATLNWDSTTAPNGAHSLTAALVGGQVVSPAVNVTVANPVVVITAPPANSIVSGTVTLQASCSNCPENSQIQFKDGPNSIGPPAPVAAGTASVSWNTLPVGNGSHTLTAELVGTTVKSSPVSVTVNNVQSQLPRIDSITPPWFGTVGPVGVIGGFQVTGANFTPNISVFTTGLKGCSPVFQDSTHFLACFIVDSESYNPGDGGVTAQTPAGMSNTGYVVLVSLANNLRASATEFYLHDQGARKTIVYDRATGAKVREWSASGLAFALDNQTGRVVYTNPPASNSLGVANADGSPVGGGFGNGKPVAVVDVLDALACVSQPEDGLISVANISGSLSGLQAYDKTYTVGGRPFPVKRWKQGDTQSCASVDVGGNRLIIVNLTAQTFFTSTIDGLRKWSELELGPGVNIQVGFKLATADSASYLAYLHVADRKLKLFNRTTGVETLSVDLASLGGVPTELAVNPADSSVVVALFDNTTGLGRLVKVNSQTGSVTQLAQTVTFSIDCIFIEGGTAYVSNRGALPVPYNLN